MNDDSKHDGRDDVVSWQLERDGRVRLDVSLAAPRGCEAGPLDVTAAVVDGPDGPRLVIVAGRARPRA